MSASGMPTRRTRFGWSACSLLLLLIGCVETPAPSSALVAGNVQWGTDGALVFQPCGQDADLPLQDPAHLLEGMGRFASFYAGPSPDGGLEVERINYVPTEGFGCGFDWDGVLWRAAGNEPFWMAMVAEDGLTIHFAGEEPLVLPLSLSEAPTFRSGNAELILEPMTCQDSMADNVFGWTATLTLDGSTFHGCGFQGLAGVTPADP
jgi:uncharacterized membrane protein